MLISNNINNNVINLDLVLNIAKSNIQDEYKIDFDSRSWTFQTEDERDIAYSYIVENFTKKV